MTWTFKELEHRIYKGTKRQSKKGWLKIAHYWQKEGYVGVAQQLRWFLETEGKLPLSLMPDIDTNPF